MNKRDEYTKKRMAAIRELRAIQRRIINPWFNVEDINRAMKLKKLYNL